MFETQEIDLVTFCKYWTTVIFFCHAVFLGAELDWRREEGALLEVPVKNNANRFLFEKVNLPIFIHSGRNYFSPQA